MIGQGSQQSISGPGKRALAFAFLALIVAAAVLRWLYIQRISLFFDEFTTLWAARTVLERGLPLFPTGNFYTHGFLFTYLVAPFLGIFGLEETLLRLPSLLIGLGTVVAVFFIGRRFFGIEGGLVAAAAVALDPEAIAWGGRVRMYALLQLLVLLAGYAFYRGAIADDRPGWRWGALLLLVGAMFAHAEAALLLPALAVALVAARGLRWSLRPSVVGPFLVGVAGFTVVIFGVDLARALGLELAEASHLEAIHEVRPYLALPTSDLWSGLRNFAPAFVDWWRLPFTLLSLVGLVYVLRRRQWQSPLAYLYLVLGVALGELLFLAGPTWQTPRYAFMLLPLLWLIAGGVLALWLRRRAVWLTVAVVLAVALLVGVTGYGTAFTQEWGYDRAFRFVREAWQPGDIVLTTNPPASALYLDQADYYAMQYGYEEYVMAGAGDQPVDRWVGAPLLDKTEQLRELLATAPRVWLVVDGWRFQSRFDHDFIRTVLDQMEPAFEERGMAVFVGEGYVPRPEPAASQSLAVEFDQQLALEGFELSADALHAGDELEVSLRWRALEAPRTAYTVYLHLIGPDGQRVAQRDELLLGGYYQPTVWPEGQAVVDRHTLDLPAELVPGRYRLEMGLYAPGDQSSVPPTSPAQEPVVLDYLNTARVPPSEPEVAMDANFGGQVQLIGYNLTCGVDTLLCQVQLHWQATAEMDTDYTVFVHMVGPDGAIASQHDAMPQGGAYPTSAWEPGETVIDDHAVELPASGALEDYSLLVGLYQAETGDRLPLFGADGQPEGDSVALGPLPGDGDQ